MNQIVLLASVKKDLGEHKLGVTLLPISFLFTRVFIPFSSLERRELKVGKEALKTLHPNDAAKGP